MDAGGLLLGLVQALAVSTITALALWAYRRWKTRRDHARIHQKYPVAGTYHTVFDDEEDGEAVRSKALLDLHQHGRSIRGQTTLEGRSWDLDGIIGDSGHLSGSYRGSSPQDPGRGSFYMEPDITSVGRRYAGLWAGYDSTNKRVRSGGYTWTRLSDVRIDAIGASDERTIEQAGAILGSALGQRYVTREDVAAYVKGAPDKHAFVTFNGTDVVGVELSEVLGVEQVAKYDQELRTNGVRQRLAYHRLGFIKSVAVDQSARGQGVGSRLIAQALRRLQQERCTAVLTISWESGTGDASLGMFEALGFATLARIPEYWKTESTEEDYDCPRCGHPCTCAAIFMLKTL